jgi:MerR family transcriptional regulator, thiopeptide resistance regulator
MQELLSPTEAARHLGATVKALKLYERLGLVRPLRTAAGWRLYGSAELVRLHEVLALKSLGLSLANIRAALVGRTADLERTLALQEAALLERRREGDRALARVRQIRRRLAAGDVLSSAELVAVIRDTTAPPQRWPERMMDYYRRHLGEAALSRLKPGDPALWSGLVAELKTLTATEAAPESPTAQDFLRRWIAASHAVSGGDPEVDARAQAAWTEAMEDPAHAADLPIGKAELDYLTRLGTAPSGAAP